MFKNPRLTQLQLKLKAEFKSPEQALKDPRCNKVAAWVMQSLWDPQSPHAAPLADPDLQRPGVTAPIIGPRTMQQLEEALPAVTLKLDEKTMTRLDEIWPGPGGEAPEAYAW
jgi:hypothetical protein